MKDLFDNKLFVPVATALLVGLVLLAANRVVVDKVADRVIQKLQRDYSPSPFSPGFDPDKIDMSKIKK